MKYTKEQLEPISEYLDKELEDSLLEGIGGGRGMNDEEFAHLSKTLQKLSSQPGFTKEDNKRLKHAVMLYSWAMSQRKEGTPTMLFDFKEWDYPDFDPRLIRYE